MASSFARQDGGGGRLLLKEDDEYHEQVFGERARCMWEDSEHRTYTTGFSVNRDSCKGCGWMIERKRRTRYRSRIKKIMDM